jgi:hypothetical protein
LKEIEKQIVDDNIIRSSLSEECSKCGSLLSKTPKRIELKSAVEERQQSNIIIRPHSLSSPSPSSSLSKFQTAYEQFNSRSNRLTFDIEKIDSSMSLMINDCVCVVGGEYTANAIPMRLCVRALISKRQGGFGSSTVMFVDAGGGGKSSDIYQCINFALQDGLGINKVLQNIIISRAFTIHQLANIIIYQLPKIVQQFNAKVIVIADLPNLFTHDPNTDCNEAIYLIKEITNSFKKTLDNTLVVVSFQKQHHSKSYVYTKILLPRFDKRIEITNNNNSKMNLLNIKVYKNYSKYCNRLLLLQEKDLQLIPLSR